MPRRRNAATPRRRCAGLSASDREHCLLLLAKHDRLLVAIGETMARKEALSRALMLCTRYEDRDWLTSELCVAEAVMRIRLGAMRRLALILERVLAEALGPAPAPALAPVPDLAPASALAPMPALAPQ